MPGPQFQLVMPEEGLVRLERLPNYHEATQEALIRGFMRKTTSALDCLAIDNVPTDVEPHFDRDRQGAALVFDRNGFSRHTGPRVILQPGVISEAELEEAARALIAHVARPVRPSVATVYLDTLDVGYGPSYGRYLKFDGATYLVGEAEFFGIRVQQDGASGLMIHNPKAVVRLDHDAPPLPLHFLRPRLRVNPEVLRARRRAKALLFRYLAPHQKWELRAHNRVTVTGQDGRTYRIYARYGHNVKRVVADRETHSFCIIPDLRAETIPVYDLMLAHKVLLERDLGNFMRTANISKVNPASRGARR